MDCMFGLYCLVLNVNVQQNLAANEKHTKKGISIVHLLFHLQTTRNLRFHCMSRIFHGFCLCLCRCSLIFAHVSNMNAKFAFNEKIMLLYGAYIESFSIIFQKLSLAEFFDEAHTLFCCHYCSHCLSLSLQFGFKWNKIVQRDKKRRNKFCFIEVGMQLWRSSTVEHCRGVQKRIEYLNTFTKSYLRIWTLR